MPVRAPVNCNCGPCRAPALSGSAYCQQHQKPPEQRVEAAQHERNRTRKEPWRKWYHTAHWKRLRTLVLARDPICKRCNRNASTIADHIRAHKGAWHLFVDMANLQGLCKVCHDIKTATEDGGFGSAAKDESAPVQTGTDGKQFSSSALGEDALDRALAEDL
jgi:5-methylcytosine-specific restriction protein A